MSLVPASPLPPASALHLLSWNMQAGMGTRSYRDYALRWHENWHPGKKHERLTHASSLLKKFDVVGLQECDLGSWRSGRVHQGELLAKNSGFDYAHYHLSRNMAPVAGSGLALLSRYPLVDVRGHKLPSRIPGRGALEARVLAPGVEVRILVVHLSLGAHDRHRQVEWIHAWVAASPLPSVVMGDFNVGPACARFRGLLERANEAFASPHSFPSWRPRRAIDHVLAFGLHSAPAQAHDPMGSDHLALSRHVWPVNADDGTGSRECGRAPV